MRAYNPRWSTRNLARALETITYIDTVRIVAPSTYDGIRHPAQLRVTYTPGGRVEYMPLSLGRDILRAAIFHNKTRNLHPLTAIAADPRMPEGYVETLTERMETNS